MPRSPAGTLLRHAWGRLRVRVVIGDDDRASSPLDPTEEQGEQSEELAARLAVRLRAWGRAHNTRSTFISVAPANRAGERPRRDLGRRPDRAPELRHDQRCRRAARTFAELGLGELASLARRSPSSREAARRRARTRKFGKKCK